MSHIYSLQNFYTILYDKISVQNCVITRQHARNNGCKQVNKIIDFWGKNKDMWFSHEIINIHNYQLINTPINRSFNQFLSFILQYDQLYRHPSIQTYNKYNIQAYRFATYCALYIINNLFEYFINAPPWQQVFILLTIRHNESIKMKYLALKKVNYLISKQLENNITINPLYLRFLNATIMDIDKHKNTQGHTEYIPIKDDKYTISQTILECCPDLLQKHKCIHMLYKNILDVSSITNTSSKDKMITKYDIEKNTKKQTNAYINYFEEIIVKHIQERSNKRIALSISGGVDSMVCSYILQKIAVKYGIEVICLHICYNNRSCVDDELMFLSSWCSILGMKLYVRKIDEIQRMRNTKFRACYEEVTRKIRFSFYKTFDCPVILGHNLDDCYENAFSNLSKQIHFDNLYGMKPVSVESGIHILRPFLSVSKDDIIKYANDAVIPHLFDSTPPWSRRGQTRNTLMRSINDFDSNILDGLRNYINHTNFLTDVWQTSFDTWINQYKIKKAQNPNYIVIEKEDFFNKNCGVLNFWIQLWFQLELPTRPSNKSFKNFINILKNTQYVNCNLNKLFSIMNNENNIVIVKCIQ